MVIVINYYFKIILILDFWNGIGVKLSSEILNVAPDQLGRELLKADISVADGESR
jgi:hypothetical protein